jgi:hypothetical protein
LANGSKEEGLAGRDYLLAIYVSFQYPSLLSLLSLVLKLEKLGFSSISTEAGHGPRLRQNKEEIICFSQLVCCMKKFISSHFVSEKHLPCLLCYEVHF